MFFIYVEIWVFLFFVVLNEFNKLFDFEVVLEYIGFEDLIFGNIVDGDDFNIFEVYYFVRLFF